MKIKGQNIRLAVTIVDALTKIAKKVYFAASTTCSLNVGADVEDGSTKDDAINGVAWRKQEVTGKNWEGSAEMQIVDDAEIGVDGIGGFDLADMVGQEVDMEVELVEGVKNRTTKTGLHNGKVLITGWQMTAPNRQTATVSVNFQGQGELKKGPLTPAEDEE